MDYTKRDHFAFPKVAYVELGRPIQPLRLLLIGSCLLCGIRYSRQFSLEFSRKNCAEEGNGNNFGRVWFLPCPGHLFGQKRISTFDGPCLTVVRPVASFRRLPFRVAQPCLTLNAAVALSCRYSTKIPRAPISFLRGRALRPNIPTNNLEAQSSLYL